MGDSHEVIALIGATLIDGNGGTPIPDGVILIERGRFTAVTDRSAQIPPNAKQISVRGKYVVPGLIASYTYLVDGTEPATTLLYEGRYDEVAIEAAQLALRGGVTTVFDGWGPRDFLIKARNAINQGRVPAARIYVCGNWVGLGGPYSDDMRPQHKASVGPTHAARVSCLWEANVGETLTRLSLERARREVRAYVHSGIDFVTYPVNVHRAGAFQYLVFPPRLQHMIVEEAHLAGKVVRAIFATTDEGMRLAVEAGADVLAPIPLVGQSTSAETMTLIAQKAIPCLVNASPSEEVRWYRERLGAVGGITATDQWEIQSREIRALISAGAPLISALFGLVRTADLCEDLKDHFPPGDFDLLGERHVAGLQGLLDNGLSPMAALMSVTRNVARAFKVDRDLGTLERGKLADLIVLDADPLQSPQNYRSISLVMKEGQIIDRALLPTKKLLTSKPSLVER